MLFWYFALKETLALCVKRGSDSFRDWHFLLLSISVYILQLTYSDVNPPWDFLGASRLQQKIAASWRSHDHCLIKVAPLPTPTAFCHFLNWIDAGVSVQNPQVAGALQTHFHRSGKEVMLSSRSRLFSCAICCFPEGSSWSSAASSEADWLHKTIRSLSDLLWQSKTAIQMQFLVLDMSSYGGENKLCRWINHVHLWFSSTPAVMRLISLWLSPPIKHQQCSWKPFIVCLKCSNNRHKARLWVHINVSHYH